jgi:hypothetical protein
VLRTLWLPPGAAARDALLQPVVRARCAAGHWSSYWWRSDLYATEASLRALAWAGRSDACSASRDWLLAGPTPETAFERALHLRALSHLPEVPLEALRRGLSDLLAEQLPDGTFHPGAWLRVTDPACSAPWAASSGGGRLYLDDGLFTTATAVAALAVWASRIPNR